MRSSCQPCCNPSELGRSVESYRPSVLQILCGIFASLTGQGITIREPVFEGTYIEDLDDTTPEAISYVSNPVKGVSIQDIGGSIIEVTIVPTSGAGNLTFYVPASGQLQFELTTTSADFIESISLVRLTGSGALIVNALDPGV